MQKRNPDTKKYEPYSIPKNWNCPLYTATMDEKINCTSCWKRIIFWDCYTSIQIHNQVWFWYPVCPNCYWKERK